MSTSAGGGHVAKRLRIGERTMLACTNCKQRKLKCDAQTPRCTNCLKADRDCLVEDPASGLQRPRDYIQSLESQNTYLEARLAYLENLLKEARPEVAYDHLQNPGSTGTQPDDAPSEARSTEAEAPATDVLSNEVALLCLSAAGREAQYFGPSSALSFSMIASRVMGLPRQRTSSSLRGNGEGVRDELRTMTQTRSKTRLISEFPSANKVAQLSQAYFKNIQPQYPFLHRQTIQEMERRCLEASLKGELDQVDDMSIFFVLMVYAIGSLAMGKDEMDKAEILYAMALDHIGTLMDMDNLQSIQAILACAVYSIRSPIGVSLWKLSGMAIRHCVELGYHRSTKKYRTTTDPLTQEMSKRCFWVAYDIDRVASFILGRPVGIADSAIDVELPLDIDDEDISHEGLIRSPRADAADPPRTMTAALHAIKLRQLWSKFHDNIYSSISHPTEGEQPHRGVSVETLRQELEDWRAAIPASYASDATSRTTLSVFASERWFILAYDYSILLLYRHYITGNQEDEGLSPASKCNNEVRERAFEICAEHARDICQIYRHLYQSQGAHIQFTWGSLHILFLGGLTYLYCLWRSERVRQKLRPTTVMNTCMACTTVLIIIADRWPQAIAYRDIFENLSEKTINMMCGEDPNSGAAQAAARNAPSNPVQLISDPDGGDLSGSGNDFANMTSFDPNVPLQDWLMGLDEMEALGDSQWLAQELFQGLRDLS
ncbi:fungal specific transcription factor domain-containing protein [Sarocladium implicatum]|nr:fungal specific transcription factor domain-containing protein [Sarocladium implicatum]